MRSYTNITYQIIFFLITVLSCYVEDINQDEITNEIKVACTLTDSGIVDYIDKTVAKEVWITSEVINGCNDRKFNSLGICWNNDPGILPTINSDRNEKTWAELRFYADGVPVNSNFPYLTLPANIGIPVTNEDGVLHIRAYIRFNDTIIRYSEPMVVVNPFDYAH